MQPPQGTHYPKRLSLSHNIGIGFTFWPCGPSRYLGDLGRDTLRLAVVGCGYVGLVTGACLAEAGHDVICTDIDKARIAQLQAGVGSIFEGKFQKSLASPRAHGKIFFTPHPPATFPAHDAHFSSPG